MLSVAYWSLSGGAKVAPVTEIDNLLKPDGGFKSFMLMRPCDDEPGFDAVFSVSFHERFERVAGSGQWHGGVIASLVDMAGAYALVRKLGSVFPTTEMSINFLRPAISGALIARCRCRKVGRTISVVDIDIECSGNLVAIGRASYATVQTK
jgi:uncharacterized protein (TIGR00369 family)